MDIQKAVDALQDYHRHMVDSDPTVQELRIEADRLKTELSDSTNHYNGVINGLRDEVERLKASVANQMELNHALAEMKTPIRPEPSRLEIAAMMMASVACRRDLILWGTKEEAAWAIDQANALIAAAKEVTK